MTNSPSPYFYRSRGKDKWLSDIEDWNETPLPRIKDTHNCYLEKGGKIKDMFLYHSILKAISVEIINEILTRGSRIEIPFFGEVYVEEKEVLRSKKRTIHYDKLKPGIVFKTFLQSNSYMKLYATLDLCDIKTTRFFYDYKKKPIYSKKRFFTETALLFNVRAAKRKRKVYFYKKILKKKE